MPASPVPVAPFRPGLAFGQRLLASASSPDVILQALDTGLLDGVDLNAIVEGKPLSEHWARRNVPHTGVTGLAEVLGVEPKLDWPVDTQPEAIALPFERGWDARAIWWEHAAVRLVQKGLDPLQPWTKDFANLLEYASERDHPWLLQACLAALPEDRRRLEARARRARPSEDDDTTETLFRMHEALEKTTPLLAQVWWAHGADLQARDTCGETPIFRAGSAATLAWALSVGANPSDLSHSGQLPLEQWRRQVDDSDEWSRMQALTGTSSAQTLALLRSAVAKGDTLAFQKAWGLLDNPAATFENGQTVLGYVAEQALRGNDSTGRTRHWRVEVCKMLSHLWTRTDWAAAQASVALPPLNDLQVAWVASMAMERSAGIAAERALKRRPFALPSPADVLRWGHRAFDDDSKETDRAWSMLRDWVSLGLRQGLDDNRISPEALLEATGELRDHHRKYAVSWSEPLYVANALLPVCVRARQGMALPDGVAGEAFAQTLEHLAMAVQFNDSTSSARWELEDFQEAVSDLGPSSSFRDHAIRALAVVALAWTDQGTRVPVDRFQGVLRQLEDAHAFRHPDVRPLAPVIAMLKEQAMEDGLPAAAPRPRGPRF